MFEPDDWGFDEDFDLIEKFYWDQRNSQNTLTLTGSWLNDEKYYGRFKEEVRLYNWLYSIREQGVKDLLDELEKQAAGVG